MSRLLEGLASVPSSANTQPWTVAVVQGGSGVSAFVGGGKIMGLIEGNGAEGHLLFPSLFFRVQFLCWLKGIRRFGKDLKCVLWALADYEAVAWCLGG